MRKQTYLALGVLGTVLTYSQFIPYFLEGGSVADFLMLPFANRVAAGLAFDLIVTVAVAVIFMFNESGDRKVPNLWLSLLAILLVGISLGLPLFLYFREDSLERQAGLKRRDR